jgi:hypothetical protein
MQKYQHGSQLGLSLIALLLGFSQSGQSYASEAKTYFITEANGYGVEDCLGEDGECGQVVANAWCEALGRGAALKFGKSEDNSDAAPQTSTGRPAPYFITCGD